MQIYEIPLTNIQQIFDVEVQGSTYTIRVVWNEFNNTWMLDVYDAITTDSIILSMPLVAGTNLMTQYRHKDFIGRLVVYTEGDAFANPTENNLGAQAKLYVGIE